ncbi:MAG: ERF family protein [Candidatus Omnitrophota bacterium]
MEILNKIQKELKAPKGQTNAFGGYKYRSCEDILEAVKPLLGNAVLSISDEIVLIGDRYYVKASVTLTDGTKTMSTTAFARESLLKKGMDESQITGAASSYARKYALNGLFCIDDTKDADTTNNAEEKKPEVVKITDAEQLAIDAIYSALLDTANEEGLIPDKNAIAAYYYSKTKVYPTTKEHVEKFVKAMTATVDKLKQICKPLPK